MARVRYVSPDELSDEDRPLLHRPIHLARAMANSPDALRHFDAIGQWIRFDSALDPRLRELAILQVGWTTRSPYEWSHHVEISQRFGVTTDDIQAIAVESGGEVSDLAEVDRLVLRATRELTTDLVIADETWNALRGYFSEELLVDLVVVISFYNQVVRLLGALEIDVEPDYRGQLTQFPLPIGDR